jgi:hypothetical protein
MATQLNFDNAVIGSNTVTTAMMVRGGTYNPEISINETVTSDGKLHQVPVYKGGTASIKLYGNKLDHNSAIGLGVTLTLKQSSTTIATGTGLASASYDEASNTTDIELKFDPTTDSE